MIHQVHLSEITRVRLTNIVMLQIYLLDYAANTSNFCEPSCRTYLEESPRFQGRSKDIVKWIWNAPVNRRGKLERFAQYTEFTDKNAQSSERQRKQPIFRMSA